MAFGGRMDGCGQCVKFSMFIVNFLIFVSILFLQIIPYFILLLTKFFYFLQCGGATVFGLGLWSLIDNSFVNELLGTNLFSGAVYVLIGTSALVCVLSFFGCLGAAREVKCMLLTVS